MPPDPPSYNLSEVNPHLTQCEPPPYIKAGSAPDLGGPEKGLAGQRPALTGWLLRRLLLLRRCCSGDSEELRRLLLLRLLNDLCGCQIW